MRLATRTLSLEEMTPELLAQWRSLADTCIEPNLYLCPQFVLPAARWLTPQAPPEILVVESIHDGKPGLLGLMLLAKDQRSRAVPLRHVRSYRTLHTFTDGLLVSPSVPEATVQAIFDHLARMRPVRHALHFQLIPRDRPVFELLEQVARRRQLRWFGMSFFERAVANLAPTMPLEVRRSVHKDIGRNWRRLSELGQVRHRVAHGPDIGTECIERHLELEHMGWKGEIGTSMLSRPHETAFFREMSVNLLHAGRAVFSEVVLDGKAISSTSNFICGRELFAFKVGWNPEFARFGLGLISELKLTDELAGGFANLLRYDSGTAGPSYVDRILPHRATMTSGYFSLTPLGSHWLSVVAKAWPLKEKIGHFISRRRG
jgi:CelD/BcsL family acetyltransferase involved in cellulose biosynthesis